MAKVAGDRSDSGDGKETLPRRDQGVSPASGEKDQQDQTQAKESYTADEVEARIREVKTETEQQIDKVRSSLMSAQAQKEKEWTERDREYQQRIHDLTVKDMDEQTRAAYEAKLYKQRAAELEGRLGQKDSELQAALQIGNYVKSISTAFDVDISQLDMTDLDALGESGWEAAAEKHRQTLQELEEAKAQLKTARGSDSSETDGLPEPPPVESDDGSVPKSVTTLTDLRKSVSEKMGLDRTMSEEELFMLAERPEETGVDLNVVLEAVQAEIDAQEK